VSGTMWAYLLIAFVPWVLLTVGGTALWRRIRTWPALLVPVGFAMCALNAAFPLFFGATSAWVKHPALRLLGVVGSYLAAVSLLCVVAMWPKSPNNRWRGP